jgi:hypothetical protein
MSRLWALNSLSIKIQKAKAVTHRSLPQESNKVSKSDAQGKTKGSLDLGLARREAGLGR